MDRIRAILANVQKQLGQLSVTQKLLIASLCVVFLMTLFLVSQYAGSPATVALLPGGTGEDQQKAAAFLGQRNILYKVAADGKIMLTQDQRYVALAAMAKEQQIPGDKKLLFEGLVTQMSWIEDLQTKQTKKNIALQNELARVIRGFPGIDDASVFIAPQPDNGGLGANAKKAVAQVAVFPVSGQGLDQSTVNALADLVAGSVNGLDVRDVAVVDGRNKRSYRAVSGDDLAGGGGTYIEQVAKVEKRLQDKLTEHLRFIPDAIVSVNAIVDAARRDSKKTIVLPKGSGSENFTTEETTAVDTSSNSAKGPAEPGPGSNVAMDINRAGGGGSSPSTSNETSSVKSLPQYGTEVVNQRDASGRPTKINVTVSVPREYVAAIVKQKKGGAAAGGAPAGGGATTTTTEPTDDEIGKEFDSGVKTKIEEMISPLVETEGMGVGGGGAATQLVAGTVKAFLIPVSMVAVSGGGGGGGGAKNSFLGGGGSGGIGSISAIMENGLVKTAVLGFFALIAMGMMFMMVKKAGKSAPLPTAEELVGIPPALEPGTDVVGEAMEGDTAMQGIEVDDDSLRTGKMLEEIGTLVKSNPQTAASVFNRWLTESE